MAHSLEHLNDNERDLLLLLAQGHTAKTIAHSQGLSVNVVNERLRSARRKTGAPSSRYLARLIADDDRARRQESCDKVLVIERPPSEPHRVQALDLAAGAEMFSRYRRPITMLTVAVISALLAYQTSVPDVFTSGMGEAQTPLAQPKEVVPLRGDNDGVSSLAQSVARNAAARAESELTPDQRELFRNPSIAEYRTICASDNSSDEGYCSGVIFSQLGGYRGCVPAAVNSNDLAVSRPALSLLVERTKAQFEIIPAREAETLPTFVQAALSRAYPCGQT